MNNHHKLSALLVFAFGFGCAGAAQQGDNQAKNAEPVTTRQKLVNMSPIDLANCFPQAPALPAKLNAQVLTGLLYAARPVVMECLVDPKNRGAAEETQFTLETSLDAGKLTHKFEGTNLTPAGEQCIRSAVDKFVMTAPDWSAKASAATKSIGVKAAYQHSTANMAAVKFGVSEASDVTGTVRLAQGSFCDCYASWKGAEPTTLKASIKLKKDAAATVTFDAAQDATAQCLLPKVTALPLKTTSGELTLPYTFAFTNSMYDQLFASAAPDIAFAQYEALRTQYFAASIIADGGRVVASEADGAAVALYQKGAAELPAVQATCTDLMKAHDNYVAALEKELALEEKVLALVTEWAATDATWGPTKESVAKQAEGSKKDIETAKGIRGEDDAMCAKRYPAAAPAKPKK